MKSLNTGHDDGPIHLLEVLVCEAKIKGCRTGTGAAARLLEEPHYEAEEKRWSKLAERVGIEAALLFQPQQVDWAKVGRVPLSDFQATDLTGRRWTLQDGLYQTPIAA